MYFISISGYIHVYAGTVILHIEFVVLCATLTTNAIKMKTNPKYLIVLNDALTCLLKLQKRRGQKWATPAVQYYFILK